jgi:hypothetical protein
MFQELVVVGGYDMHDLIVPTSCRFVNSDSCHFGSCHHFEDAHDMTDDEDEFDLDVDDDEFEVDVDDFVDATDEFTEQDNITWDDADVFYVNSAFKYDPVC